MGSVLSFNHNHMDKKPNPSPTQSQRRKIGLWVIPFVLAIPFALLFILSDAVIAKPLEKHRHKNTAVWLLWNFLRMSLPLAVLVVMFIVIGRLRHH